MIGTVAILAAGYHAWSTGTVADVTRTMQMAGPVPIAGWAMLVAATSTLVILHHNRFLALILIGIVGLMVSVGFCVPQRAGSCDDPVHGRSRHDHPAASCA